MAIDWDGEERRAREDRRARSDYEVIESCTCDQTDRIQAIQDVVTKLAVTIAEGEHKVRECKNEIDSDIHGLHEGMESLRADMGTISSGMHEMAAASAGMQASMATIAKSLEKLIENLEEFPEAWKNFRGWWKTMAWIRANAFLLFILGAALAWAWWPVIQKVREALQ